MTKPTAKGKVVLLSGGDPQIAKADELDEAQMAARVKQAAALPGRSS